MVLRRTRSLRRKLGLLAIVYLLSLFANLALSSVCIMVYFRSSYRQAGEMLELQQGVEQLRMIFRQLRDLDEAGPSDSMLAERRELLAQRLNSLSQQLAPLLLNGAFSAEWMRIQAALAPGTVSQEADVDRELSALVKRLVEDRSQRMTAAAATQQSVISILLVNTALGALLCGAGLLLIRRWVVQPVQELRKAAERIAQGDFAYRLRPRQADELGKLAEEVNLMAARIVEIGERLVDDERFNAAGRTIEQVHEEIRRPLGEIRRVVQEVAGEHPDDPEANRCHRQILDTLDRCEQWLDGLQQSMLPLSTSLRLTRVGDLVEEVLKALRPVLERHRVRVNLDLDPAVEWVEVDTMHFEHAVVALVTNAVEASSAGKQVTIRVCPGPNAENEWAFMVEDQGAGIPVELQKKVFQPFFTTKAEGNGLGLPMAAKVIHQHGGEISVESQPGAGTRFTAVLPRRPAAKSQPDPV